MLNIGIIGATGYAGAELYRLLLNHPRVHAIHLSSISFEGKNIAEVYGCFHNISNQILVDSDEVITKSDVIFASLPHGLSENLARKCFDAQKLFIDLGADFRLDDAKTYEQWYNYSYNHTDLHTHSTYGLSEIYKTSIQTAKIIGNPGCYPTAIALGLYVALKNNYVSVDDIIIDAKSGVTGAGRSLSQTTHFPDCNESFSPYKVGAHRHTPEIEQTLSNFSHTPIKVTFVPHLLPINRGIIATMYLNKNQAYTLDEIIEGYQLFYKDHPFVRVLQKGDVANLKWVKYSNYCDLSCHEDLHTGKLIIVSAIDNMVKGAAGQAIQNMNICLGFNETEGLNLIPPAF